MKKYYAVKFRRKRNQQTNYKKRLSLLKSNEHRLVVRVRNNSIIAQLVEFVPQGDKVLATINSNSLGKIGYNGHNSNGVSAYLIGLLIAKKALKLGIKNAIPDFGLQLKKTGNKLFAVVKGANEVGLEIPVDEKMYPNEERINGTVIKQYAESLDESKLKERFSGLIKNGLDPKNYIKHVESVKEKIMNS